MTNFVNRNRLHVVISDSERCNPPICEINPNHNLLSTLHSFMTVSYKETQNIHTEKGNNSANVHS